MSEILKEYIRRYLSINEDKAHTRSKKSEDASFVIQKINSYLSEKSEKSKNKQRLEEFGSASQGKKDTDIQAKLIGHPGVDPDFLWNFEIKSFGSNDKFSIEITNPSSLVRKIVLKANSQIGSKEDREKQMKLKLASSKEAIGWVEDNLRSPKASTWGGSILIPGDPEPRDLKLIKGEIGDWGRLRSVGGSGTARDFYTVSNYDLKQSENEMYYTDELEKAIEEQFVEKKDHVLVIMGSDGSIRCFGLTDEAKKVFGFPKFYDSGNTLEPESAKLSSFGGGGRITTIVRVKQGSGRVIRAIDTSSKNDQ